MKNAIGVLSLISMSLMACDGQVRFNQADSTSLQSVSDAVYSKSSGNCASDSSTSVVSCMKCEIPAVPAEQPPMSSKAIQLMNIMAATCPINRAYFNNNYAATTIADHQAKLSRCSATAYPATTPDSGQNDVLQRLLNNDTWLQNKMFTGLWYEPPYSDYFETYFGIEVGQAIQLFCQQSISNITGALYPSMTQGNPYGPKYKPGDDMPDMYVKANVYRSQLQACIAASESNPWQPSGTTQVAKTCSYETLSGPSGDQINTQVSSWLSAGYTVGADLATSGVCLAVQALSDISSYQGNITVGAYICK